MLETPGLKAVERGLELTGLRQAAIAQNVANLNTPGYKRAVVSFDQVLQERLSGAETSSLDRTHPDHLPGRAASRGRPRLDVDTSTSTRADGSNVDLEYEMTLLAENALLQEALVRQAGQRIAALRTAISEGRR